MNMFLLLLLLLLLLVLLSFPWDLKALESTTLLYNNGDTDHSIMQSENITKPGCQRKCGGLDVPFPFGIKTEGLNCSLDTTFDITCNYSSNPPKAFIQTGNLRVYDISNTEVRVENFMAYKCYSQSGQITDGSSWSINLEGSPYTYSDVNVFTVVGCDDYANIYRAEGTLPQGCSTTCENKDEVAEDECSGRGCCQVSVNLVKYFKVNLESYYNHTNGVSSFNWCGYAFLADKKRFKFRGTLDLNDSTFGNRNLATSPIVLSWLIGNDSCTDAAQDTKSFACKYPNSYCINGPRSRGYRCSCKEGFEGNPYLIPGCKDIDECEQQRDGCEQVCINTIGSFICSCRKGSSVDVRDPKRCITKASNLFKYISGILYLFIFIGLVWLCCIMRKRKQNRLRKKFFKENGGLLLKQQITSDAGTLESTKLFKDEELKKATNNYAPDRILGQGGYGIVYKGILPDQRVVAIKKSKLTDKSQIEQFINEVVILTQINHRNVVKLLGCCLECEVPLLVYEFVSNGTLHYHIHNNDEGSFLSLASRLKIAAESSSALAYLHSAASIPIIHRDVKLANILLDEHHVAKISDFGASRLVPMDQTEVVTLVQGTLGYLDPEYFHSGQLTDKSDVYSFGVVLAELLTGRKPICMANPQEERNLATFFITSMKENRLFQILEPRIVREGTLEQLEEAAQLVRRCLKLNGDERPTMKEVMMELEGLRKSTTLHPWSDPPGKEETTSFIDQTQFQDSDLYEIQLNSYNNDLRNDIDLYSSSTNSWLSRINSYNNND